MKLVMDERVKHRLIGLAVILSIAAIFAPAIIKKSNQRIDENVSVSVQLPPKPIPPKVAMPEEKTMFETVKVAHVEIPQVPQALSKPALAKAESLSQLNEIKQAVKPMVAKAKIEPSRVINKKTALVVAAKKVVSNPHAHVVVKPRILASKSRAVKTAPKPLASIPKGRYAVQLATFAKQQNADSLISKLRAKGYKATYSKVSTDQGTVYKVIVGQANQKEQAKILQQQLASVMQIKGFIVSTGVS